MTKPFHLTHDVIAGENRRLEADLGRDAEHLADVLARRGLGFDALVARARAFRIAVPSWGLATGGTRFARFPMAGEPRDVFEKLDDCQTINRLIHITPLVSLHIPWDKPRDAGALRRYADERGLVIDSMNSNTFEDQEGQPLSYKHGSLAHPDPAVRQQAIAHNLECIEIGRALGASSLTVWIGDGGNFAGQMHFRDALAAYLDSMRTIYAALPADWRLLIEHKLAEPAFYSTVINDWGTSYWAAERLGPQAFCLVDLGHHAPNVNIEMIVARLIQFGKLGGFHFNDSKYGDDDLDAGSIKPFQLFLIFNELVDAELAATAGFTPAYMLDQSHNVTDPMESLMVSAMEVQRAYIQAHLIDREALGRHQRACDAVMALRTLKQAFTTDVEPILATARLHAGGAIDPIAAYRASGYRQVKAAERPRTGRAAAGIV
jgi:L-rhamnose isomerase/sugar isomerase